MGRAEEGGGVGGMAEAGSGLVPKALLFRFLLFIYILFLTTQTETATSEERGATGRRREIRCVTSVTEWTEPDSSGVRHFACPSRRSRQKGFVRG